MYAFHLTICIVLLINAVCVLVTDHTCPSAGTRAFAVLVDIVFVIWGFATLPH